MILPPIIMEVKNHFSLPTLYITYVISHLTSGQNHSNLLIHCTLGPRVFTMWYPGRKPVPLPVNLAVRVKGVGIVTIGWPSWLPSWWGTIRCLEAVNLVRVRELWQEVWDRGFEGVGVTVRVRGVGVVIIGWPSWLPSWWGTIRCLEAVNLVRVRELWQEVWDRGFERVGVTVRVKGVGIVTIGWPSWLPSWWGTIRCLEAVNLVRVRELWQEVWDRGFERVGVTVRVRGVGIVIIGWYHLTFIFPSKGNRYMPQHQHRKKHPLCSCQPRPTWNRKGFHMGDLREFSTNQSFNGYILRSMWIRKNMKNMKRIWHLR